MSKAPFISKFTKGYRWEPAKIVYEATDEDLTAAGGLGNIVDLFVDSPQYEEFRRCLPKRESNASYDTAQFALTVLSSFWFAHECLEDVEEFDEDPGLEGKLGEVPSPRAVGDWLRDFESDHLSRLQDFCTRQGLSMRKKLCPNAPIVLDMDSTSHVQSGHLIEGVAYNYKNEWALDSLVSYDELGFGYRMKLRPGNTFSAEGAPSMIDEVFSKVDVDAAAKKLDRYYRADSAFCNEDTIRACMRQKARFTITAHGNTGWEQEAHRLADHEWSEWVYAKDEIDASVKKRKPLPRMQLATLMYRPGWSETLRFTVVVKRTWVEHEQRSLFSGQGFWKYYAVLTDVSLMKFTPQSIMEHHAARGNSENFIREAKYGYDLKHFPCRKMSANQAYGLLCLVAHNFLRAMSLVDDPRTPGFSKRLRRKYVYIPGKLIRHARQLVMRIPTRFLKEVRRFKQAWAAPPPFSPTLRLQTWAYVQVP